MDALLQIQSQQLPQRNETRHAPFPYKIERAMDARRYKQGRKRKMYKITSFENLISGHTGAVGRPRYLPFLHCKSLLLSSFVHRGCAKLLFTRIFLRFATAQALVQVRAVITLLLYPAGLPIDHQTALYDRRAEENSRHLLIRETKFFIFASCFIMRLSSMGRCALPHLKA